MLDAINIQEMYEDILSAHWRKIHLLKELVETDTGHPLRRKSINDRSAELKMVENKKAAMELLFEDDLTIPEWYNERIANVR